MHRPCSQGSEPRRYLGKGRCAEMRLEGKGPQRTAGTNQRGGKVPKRDKNSGSEMERVGRQECKTQAVGTMEGF